MPLAHDAYHGAMGFFLPARAHQMVIVRATKIASTNARHAFAWASGSTA